jgi:hypothetical protein
VAKSSAGNSSNKIPVRCVGTAAWFSDNGALLSMNFALDSEEDARKLQGAIEALVERESE